MLFFRAVGLLQLHTAARANSHYLFLPGDRLVACPAHVLIYISNIPAATNILEREVAVECNSERRSKILTGVERTFDVDELIVSKTDLKGIITYANQVFLRVSQYTEPELLGQPHNLIRHPEMPRCVFRYLWDTIAAGREVFAYVVNRAKNGDHYWVFAHVTPTWDRDHRLIGYHSSRRVPQRAAVEQMKKIYAELLGVERQFSNPREGCAAASDALVQKLGTLGVSYDDFIFSLTRKSQPQLVPAARSR